MPLTPEERRERRMKRLREEYVDPFRGLAQSARDAAADDGRVVDEDGDAGLAEEAGLADEVAEDQRDWGDFGESWQLESDSDARSEDDHGTTVREIHMEMMHAAVGAENVDPDQVVDAPGPQSRNMSVSDIENFLVGLQARREVPVKVMMDIVDFLRKNSDSVCEALRNGELQSFRTMRRHALANGPDVRVDVVCEDAEGATVELVGLDRFPRKTIRGRKLSLKSSLYYCDLSAITKGHCETHPDEITCREIDVSVDGIPESRSSGLSIDVLCVRFVGCSSVYAVAIMQPWRKRLPGKDEAIFKHFLEDLPGSGLKIRRVIADAPKRAPLQGLKSHAANSSCPYCTAKKVNGQYPSSSMGQELRTDDELRRQGAEVANGATNDDGVKGIGILTSVPGLDLIKDIPAEVMHLVFLGVCRKMVKLLYKQRPVQGGAKLYPVKFPAADDTKANVMLRKQKAITDFSRRTRDLDVAVLKAEEYRNRNRTGQSSWRRSTKTS